MFFSCSLMNSMNLSTLCSPPISWSYLLVCLSQDPFSSSLTSSVFLRALLLILKISSSYYTNHFNTNYSMFFSPNPYGTTHFLWDKSIIRNYVFKPDKKTECPSTSTWTVTEKNTNIQLYGKYKELLFYQLLFKRRKKWCHSRKWSSDISLLP